MTDAERPRVLIVDDEERYRITLTRLLKAQGLEVSHVGSAREAFDELRARDFDVILLDVKMAEIDGIEALGEIKRIKPEVEVIMLTGHASVDVAVEIMRLGVFEYLLKPCPIDELMLKIDAAHERKLSRDQRSRRGRTNPNPSAS